MTITVPHPRWRESQVKIVAALRDYDAARDALIERIEAQPPLQAIDLLGGELGLLRQRVTACYARSKACT